MSLIKSPIEYCPDWLSDCCGLSETKQRIRRDRQLGGAHYFFSPSSARLDGPAALQQHLIHHHQQFQQPNPFWVNHHYDNRLVSAITSTHHQQQAPSTPPTPLAQAYILLTQPVIIAYNPGSSQMESMTLVQHARTGAPNTLQQAISQQPLLPATTTPLGSNPAFHLQQAPSGPFPMMASPIMHHSNQLNNNTNSIHRNANGNGNLIGQPGLMSSQYAIYSHLQSQAQPQTVIQPPSSTTSNTNFITTSSLPVTNNRQEHQHYQNIYSDAGYHRAAMAMVNKELQQLQSQLREPSVEDY